MRRPQIHFLDPKMATKRYQGYSECNSSEYCTRANTLTASPSTGIRFLLRESNHDVERSLEDNTVVDRFKRRAVCCRPCHRSY
jgi:hypothetical protein